MTERFLVYYQSHATITTISTLHYLIKKISYHQKLPLSPPEALGATDLFLSLWAWLCCIGHLIGNSQQAVYVPAFFPEHYLCPCCITWQCFTPSLVESCSSTSCSSGHLSK